MKFKMKQWHRTFLVFVVLFIVFQIGLHYYYEKNDIRIRKFMAVAPTVAIVAEDDLPCGTFDLICVLQKHHVFDFLTFTVPSKVKYSEIFYVTYTSKNEPIELQMSSPNGRIQDPVTGMIYPCTSMSVTFQFGSCTKSTIGTDYGTNWCYGYQRFQPSLCGISSGGMSAAVKAHVRLGFWSKDYTSAVQVDPDESNCAEGWVGDRYCKNGDVYQNWRLTSCAEVEKKRYDCSYGCTAGACNSAPACEAKWVSDTFCKNDDVYRTWQDSSCNKIDKKVEDCSSGCLNGECVTGTVPTQCEEGFIGDMYCKDNSVYQKYRSADCSESEKLVDSCDLTETCTAGQCVPITQNQTNVTVGEVTVGEETGGIPSENVEGELTNNQILLILGGMAFVAYLMTRRGGGVMYYGY